MTVHVLDPEPMPTQETTLATQMAEKAYKPASVNSKENHTLVASSDIGGYSPKRSWQHDRLIDLGHKNRTSTSRRNQQQNLTHSLPGNRKSIGYLNLGANG